MKCTMCCVVQKADQFVSKLGTRKVRTCLTCREQSKRAYNVRKVKAILSRPLPEGAMEELLAQLTSSTATASPSAPETSVESA